MRSHQNENEAERGGDVTKCAACGKQCRSKGGLKRHSRIHQTNINTGNWANISNKHSKKCNNVPCHMCTRVLKSGWAKGSSTIGPQVQYKVKAMVILEHCY